MYSKGLLAFAKDTEATSLTGHYLMEVQSYV